MFVARLRATMAALVSLASLAACSRPNSPAPPGSRETNERSACTWEWSAPETLFVHGASFGFGGSGETRLLPLGAGTALVGDRFSTYADTETSSVRFLGVSFDAKGNATPVAKPPFMGDVAGADAWVVPGLRGTVHVVWTTLSMAAQVLHATTDGRHPCPRTVGRCALLRAARIQLGVSTRRGDRWVGHDDHVFSYAAVDGRCCRRFGGSRALRPPPPLERSVGP